MTECRRSFVDSCRNMADSVSQKGEEMTASNAMPQKFGDQNGRDETESVALKVIQKVRGVEGQHKKKSSFQITGVYPAVKSGLDPDGDSLDDLDETAETHTEDVSSDIMDVSKTTDIDPDPSSAEEVPSPNHLVQDENTMKETSLIYHEQNGTKDPKDPNKDLHSRFKVVKIESTEPFRRGRWLCHDFMAPAKDGEKTEKDEGVGSGNSSAASSIHYIHGVDDPAKNPLSGTVIHSEGHPIVEPQPIYPTAQSVNSEYEFTGQQSNVAQTSGQSMVLQDSASGGVPQSGYSQSVGQTVQAQPSGATAHLQQQMVGQNGVKNSSVQSTLPQADTSVNSQDFMTRSQEFVPQSQDFLSKQGDFQGSVQMPGAGQTAGEVSAGPNASAQNVQIGSTSQQDTVGVNQTQNSTLSEYSSQPNIAQTSASPKTDNLNLTNADIAGQDSSFNKSLADEVGSATHVDQGSVGEADADAEKTLGSENVAGASKPMATSTASTVPVGVGASAQDLLTPPLLEMVSATMQQPGGITLSKDSGDER